MSETTATARVPEWDLADRMRKALRESGVGVQEIADYLGVGRNTVSTWINGKITPSKQTQRLWALRCGVPYEWLSAGVTREVTSAQTAPMLRLVTERIRIPRRRETDQPRRERDALPRPVLADVS